MKKNNSVRYGMIDAARAVAIINMIAFHFIYDCFSFAGDWVRFSSHPAAIIWERFICMSFIIISGISLNFTRRGYRRGLIVLLCGCAVTAVTYFFIPDQVIWFGVLSFLGCAMILTYALRALLNKVNMWVGTAVSLILFILCYDIPQGYIGIFSHPLIKLPEAIYELKWLAFLGFPHRSFFSADYFPILPWIFLYIFGYILWRAVKRYGLDKRLVRNVPVLSAIGRHSLLIYMVHQPVLYGVCWLIFKFINR